MWFGEISSCSCLTALPGPTWVLLSKIYKPFPGSLYSKQKMQEAEEKLSCATVMTRGINMINCYSNYPNGIRKTIIKCPRYHLNKISWYGQLSSAMKSMHLCTQGNIFPSSNLEKISNETTGGDLGWISLAPSWEAKVVISPLMCQQKRFFMVPGANKRGGERV